jgi:hypothetical protein
VSPPSWQRFAVESTTLVSVGYLSPQGVLEVAFRDGSQYRFFAVPPHCVEQLLAAGSKGGYFNQNIRNHFRFQRISSRSQSAGREK